VIGIMDYYGLFLVTVAFLIAVFGGDPIVRSILSIVERGLSSKDKSRLEEGSMQNAGRVIGYLERALIFLLVINKQLSAIAFILAAKSIIRFGPAKNRVFAEYFLVGTFSSILIAVLAAIIIT